MNPVDLTRVSKLLQFLHRFFSMLLLVGEYYDLQGIVLDEVGDNTKPNTCGTTSNNIHLQKGSASEMDVLLSSHVVHLSPPCGGATQGITIVSQHNIGKPMKVWLLRRRNTTRGDPN